VNSEKLKIIIIVFLLSTGHLLFVTAVNAEVLERIVAIVNDDIILLSEFQSALQSARRSDSAVSGERVLNEMIDNILLLNEAKRFRLGASDKSKKIETDNRAVIREYIDRRIKALIHIPYEDIEQYYQMNRDLYKDKEIIDVRDEIEEHLVDKQLSVNLREYIEELRRKAYIRIQLKEEN
jgi:RNase P protein component